VAEYLLMNFVLLKVNFIASIEMTAMDANEKVAHRDLILNLISLASINNS